MLTQLPDQDRVEHVVDRCRVLLGDDQAETLLGWLAQDWQHADGAGADRAVWCATQPLMRAVQLRHDGHHALANMLDHLAEACVTAYRGELTVRTTRVEDDASNE